MQKTNGKLAEMTAADVLLSDRVERMLRQEIHKLQDTDGAMLPRQEELVTRYGVSIRSVREAIDRLKRENLIRSIRGKGMFVVSRASKLRDVLLICNEAYHPFQLASVGVFGNVLKDRDCASSLVMTHDPVGDWQGIIQNHPNACGAVLISRFSRETISKLARESRVPVVTISDLDEPVRRPAVCDTVVPDSEALTYRATEYLARRGHKKIALLGWELTRSAGVESVQGYRNVLDAFGLPFQPEYLMDLTTVPLDKEGRDAAPAVQAREVRERFTQWRERNDLPTALIHFSASESTIRDLLGHCMENHFRPEAIVGCLYAEQLRMGYGGLGDAVVFCVRIEQLARQALDLLFRRREEHAPPVRNTVEETFMYRRTDGIWREATME